MRWNVALIYVALVVLSVSRVSAGRVSPQRRPKANSHTISYHDKSVAEWIHMLGAGEETTRENAIHALGNIGRPAVPSLIKTLRHRLAFMRLQACKALAAIGPDAEGAVPALITALEDQEPFVRGSAAEALGAIGPKAMAAVPQLILVHQSGFVPASVRTALVKIGPAAVPGVMKLLKHKDSFQRREAATILGDIGPAAEDAVPALTELLNDSEGEVRDAAAEALKKIKLTGSAAPRPTPQQSAGIAVVTYESGRHVEVSGRTS